MIHLLAPVNNHIRFPRNVSVDLCSDGGINIHIGIQSIQMLLLLRNLLLQCFEPTTTQHHQQNFFPYSQNMKLQPTSPSPSHAHRGSRSLPRAWKRHLCEHKVQCQYTRCQRWSAWVYGPLGSPSGSDTSNVSFGHAESCGCDCAVDGD